MAPLTEKKAGPILLGVLYYLTDQREYIDQAKWIGHSVPAMASAKMTEILTALGEKGLAPYITLALKSAATPDPAPYVAAAVEAMKKAGGLK